MYKPSFEDMTNNELLNSVLQTSGDYSGLTYVCKNWDFSNHFDRNRYPTGKWAYYIHINKNQVSSKLWKQIIKTKGRIFDDCGWHGGITFFDVESHNFFNKNIKFAVIGCDYNHLWDEFEVYNMRYIIEAAKKTIDRIVYQEGILVKCIWTGEYFDRQYAVEMHSDWKGEFLSPDGCGQRSQFVFERQKENLKKVGIDLGI